MADFSTPYKFLGATVKSFNQTGGNDGSPVTVDLLLIEDLLDGDAFDPPPIWHPTHFALDEFEFRGLLRSYQKINDVQNAPAYKVVITDPRPLLEGVQVVLGDFRGPTSDVPNVINAFGYWEDKLTFGGAMVSDLGMLWKGDWAMLGLQEGELVKKYGDPIGVAPAIEKITRDRTPYGGPVSFRGREYAIDLSGLPAAPENYRVGVNTATPLAAIVDDLCRNAGCDARVVLLDDSTIGFRYVDRNRPQAPGTIANWVGTQPDAVSRATGAELVVEDMNAVIVGGPVHNLFQIYDQGQNIWPFWGIDANGLLVWGEGDLGESHKFSVPCPDLADVVGDVVYPCSIAELRSAVDVDSWAAYLVCQEPDKAETLNVKSIIEDGTQLAEIFGDLVLNRDMMAVDKETAAKFGLMNENDYWTNRVQRLFDFVSRFAREFYGRRFCVRIPDEVYWKVVPDSFQIQASSEPVDGGWTPEGGSPLGLPYEEIDRFLTDDGRFSCFVAFDLKPTMDLTALSPDLAVVVNGTLYLKAEAEPKIYYAQGQIWPYAVVTLADAVVDVLKDPLGGIADLAKTLNVTKEQLFNVVAYRSSSFPLRIDPMTYKPAAVALPMRSNRDRYGPWSSVNGQGRSEFIVDDDLTPWTCGDWDTMNKVAREVVQTYATKRFEVESSQVTLARSPTVPIGDALIAGGPSVTSISVSLGTEGVTTSYTMQTYTPVPGGGFSRYQAEKLRKAGENARFMRRQIRNLYQRSKSTSFVQQQAYRGRMQNASRVVQQRSPHDCLMGYVLKGGPDPDDQKYRTSVGTMSPHEMLANMRADSKFFKNVAGMGMEGLLRPISTNFDPPEPPLEPDPDDPDAPEEGDSGAGGDVERGLPHFEDPHDNILGLDRKLLTTKDLNPFQEGCDVDLLISGDEYAGNLHRQKGDTPVDYDDARPLGFRAPLLATGWGLELTGKPFPNAAEDYEKKPVHEWDDEYMEDHLLHPEKWKAGVLGLMWSEWNKAWVSPGCVIVAKLTEDVSAGVEGEAKIQIGDEDTDVKIKITNKMPVPLSKNSLVFLSYELLAGRWIVTGSACPT